MPTETGAGALRHRLEFQSRGDGSDGFGGVVEGGGAWATEFTLSAEMRPLRGSESVIAARLAGQQPYVVRVRRSRQTDRITPAWRLVDARDPTRVFAITAPPTDPDGKRAWLDILVTEGTPS